MATLYIRNTAAPKAQWLKWATGTSTEMFAMARNIVASQPHTAVRIDER